MDSESFPNVFSSCKFDLDVYLVPPRICVKPLFENLQA